MAVAVLDEKDIRELVRQGVLLALERLQDEPRTPEIMTKKELADYLRCEISSINGWMKKDLPFEMCGSHPRFRKSSIDAWLQKS